VHAREQDLRAHYNKNPKYYSPLQSDDYFRRMFDTLDVEPDTSRVLDLGCGDGRLLKHIEPELYLGVDYSSERVALAREKWGSRFLCRDLYTYLESTPDRFTLAVAVEILEHLEEPRRVVEGALVVAPMLIGTVPVNKPYVAHLQVYGTPDDVYRELGPDEVVGLDGHFVCVWTA